jgi:predicted DNA-binding transcriptional regulator AlpA
MGKSVKHITKHEVLQMTGFDEAALDLAIGNGVFPEPVVLGDYISWLEVEVVEWVVQTAIQLDLVRKRLGGEQ